MTVGVAMSVCMVPSLAPPRRAWASGLGPSELPDLVERVSPGVVNISSTTVVAMRRGGGWDDFMQLWGIPRERKQTSLGSGFIIDAEGYVLTNNHVIADATEVVLTLLDKKQYTARLIGTDPKTDLALLQIRERGRIGSSVPTGLKSVPLGDSERVRIGESIFAVGNPFALQHTVTAGIISAKNRTIGIGPLDNFLQTDAAINPGNSGGPLFNLRGEVIGINTVIYSQVGQSSGVGFAIPINEAKSVLADLKRYGRVPRPWLGILSERVTPQIAAYYRLPVERGVVIYNLVVGSPADRLGLKQGDIITRVAKTEVSEPQELERELYKLRPNESVALEVKRGRRTLQLSAKLTELPDRSAGLPQGVI